MYSHNAGASQVTEIPISTNYRKFVKDFSEVSGVIYEVSELLCKQLLALLLQRIHPEEGKHLLAQLPLGFRRTLQNNLVLAPNGNVRQEDFKGVVTDLLPESEWVDWLLILRKFGRHLSQHISTGEMDQVRSELPLEIDRLLFTPTKRDEQQLERKAL